MISIKILLILNNIQLSYIYICVSVKNLPFYTFLHNTTRYAAFCNTIFLKSAKLTKNRLKVMEYATRGYRCIILVI